MSLSAPSAVAALRPAARFLALADASDDGALSHLLNLAEHVSVALLGGLCLLVAVFAAHYILAVLQRTSSRPAVDQIVWDAIERRPAQFRAFASVQFAEEMRGNGNARMKIEQVVHQQKVTNQMLEGHGELIREMTRAVDSSTEATIHLRRVVDELDARDRTRGEQTAALLARFDDLRTVLVQRAP